MSDPWTADIEVTAELARSLVEAQFPALAPVRLEPFGEGWDNAAWLVNGDWVFRFPRRKFAAPLLETETRALPAFARSLPLPVPVPLRVGKPEGRYPYLWAGYRKLEGTTADRAALTEAQRVAAAPALGAFLRALHATPVSPLGLAGDTIGRMDVPKRRAKALAEVERLKGEPGAMGVAALGAILADAPELPDAPPTLVHGDLYARHVLVDAAGRPSGIIDWGDVHVSDPAIDLMLAFQFLPPSARPAFFDAYGPVSDVTLRRARFRAVVHGLAVLPYALKTSDAALRLEMERALDWSIT